MSISTEILLCRVANCVAARSSESHDGYCAVHEKYQQVTGEERCRRCQKKIRTGSFAEKGPNRTLQHIGECPKTERRNGPR